MIGNIGVVCAQEQLDREDFLNCVFEPDEGEDFSRPDIDDPYATYAVGLGKTIDLPLKTADSRTWDRPTKAKLPRNLRPRVNPGKWTIGW